jgi:hypothetical protein
MPRSYRDTRPMPHDPAARGYHAVYRENQINHCPGCSRTHWYVGRVSAECGFCQTALPLAEATSRGMGTHSRNFRPAILSDAA